MKSLSFFRDFVCFHQKRVIEYETVISESHKKLRIKLDKNVNLDELNTSYNEFISKSVNLLIDTYNVSLIEHVQEYYKSPSKKNPRVAIHVINNDNITVTSISNTSLKSGLSQKSIKEDMVFKKVLESGIFYFENNIEKMIKNTDKYYNPRIIKENLEKFRNNTLEYEEIWHKKESGIFRSTIVIPMTLRNTEDTQEQLRQKFFNDVEDEDRKIFGLLCIDHEDANYFTQSDIDAGYIFADMLSFYLMFYFTHVTSSETIRIIEEKLKIN